MFCLGSISSYYNEDETKKIFLNAHLYELSINNRDFTIDKTKYSYVNFHRDSNANLKNIMLLIIYQIFLIPIL